MKLKLDCSKKHIPYLEEKLTQAGFQIDDDGALMIIDNPLHTFRKEDPLDDFKSIVFMESFGNEIHIHLSQEDEPTIIQEKLYALESKYEAYGFIRVNKSQLINIRFIKEIEPWIGQKYILMMNNDKRIDVNRTYYKKFKQYLKL